VKSSENNLEGKQCVDVADNDNLPPVRSASQLNHAYKVLIMSYLNYLYYCVMLNCPVSLCGTNKLLYFSVGEWKFLPPSAPASFFFLKLKTKKHIRDITPLSRSANREVWVNMYFRSSCLSCTVHPTVISMWKIALDRIHLTS